MGISFVQPNVKISISYIEQTRNIMNNTQASTNRNERIYLDMEYVCT